MVAPSAMSPGIIPPNPRFPFVDPKTGLLEANGGLQLATQVFQTINGLSPTVSCTCTNVGNVYTLTPFPISPIVANYYSYWSFAFVASASSTGPITATVVPSSQSKQTGVLPTLAVLKTHGSGGAGNGDLTIHLFYVLHYVDTLGSGGNGAFVLS